MAAIFPEKMNRLDVNDTAGSFGRLENYIRYMTERVEFAMRNMTRNVSDAGVSNVETLLLLNDMASALSIVSKTVNGMIGDVTTLNNRVTEMQENMTELQGKITDLESRVAALEG